MDVDSENLKYLASESLEKHVAKENLKITWLQRA